jgi:hypothetical protein
MGPDDPRADRKDGNDANSNDGVVEGLGTDGVDGWEAEDDGDEADPGNADEGNGARRKAEVEGALYGSKGAVVDECD